MAWLAVNDNGDEFIYETEPYRTKRQVSKEKVWRSYLGEIKLPNGSIEKLIGKKLTWDDEPFEI